MKIKDCIPEYLKYLQAIGRAYHTIRTTKYNLRAFARYLEAEQVFHIEDLSREVIEDYQQELAFSLTAKAKPLSVRSQVKRLNAVTGFTRFLREKDYLVHDPAAKIKMPKEPKRLPKVILSERDVRKLFNSPDMRTSLGYRDRVILEVLYDTAIRRAEAAHIKIADLDLTGGYIHIRGKGDKERVVPVSERVCELIQNYLLLVRPSFTHDQDNGYLFLTSDGHPMKVHTIWQVVKRCARRAKLTKNVTTHTFRHTCATHMLRNGAPIRHLQEMLGHASLESTQIYTQVTINDLKAIHAKYHPTGKGPK